ncbi:MAG: RAD55 family ATPase, partial [Kiritimatiellia bacterium]
MISKTLMGVKFFDDHFGGVYNGRSVLISGRKGVGKTVVGLQFLRQGLQMDERCMMLSTMSSKDFSIYSVSSGFDMQQEVENGRLILLEYRDFVPEYGFSEGNMLPPDGFDQLRSIIESNMIHRVVIDTVLPLVAISTVDRMHEHVFSFVRFLDRLNVTVLMTIPKPVSPMALRLKKTLEDMVTVSCILAPGEGEGVFTWQTVKYFGERKLVSPISYTVCPGKGLVVYNPADTSARAPSAAPPARNLSHVSTADKGDWAGSAAAKAPEHHGLPDDM